MSKVTVYGINGSPRKGGNDEQLLELALNYLSERKDAETHQINLREHEIERCEACKTCGKTRDTGEYIDCAFKDKGDAVELWDEINKNADGMILTSPVYFGLPSPLMVDFLNWSRYLRHQDFQLTNKVFGVIAISGRRTGGNETTIFSMWYPLIRNGCIPVGNMDKSCQFGCVGWAGEKGEIMEDTWGKTQAKDLATRVYNLSKIVKTGEETLSYEKPWKFEYGSGSPKEFKDELRKGLNRE